MRRACKRFRHTTTLVVILLIAFLTSGCPKKKVQELAPEPAAGAAPIDTLLQLLGRERSDITLPRADQAGYQLPLRYPVVETALEQPLGLPSWAEAHGARLDATTSIASVWAALRGLGPAGARATQALEKPPQDLDASPPERSRVPSPAPLPRQAFASKQGLVQTSQLPEPFVEQLIGLAGLLEDIELSAESWYRLDGLIRRPNRAAEEFFIDRNSGEYRFRTHPVGVQLEFLRSAVFINQGALADSAAHLLEELDTRIPALAEAAALLPPAEGRLLHLDSRFGPIIVGSRGTDVYQQDAFLVVDPGGSDQWTNNAGATGSLPSSLSVAIDLGGNDSYRRERGHAQGAGFLGIGVLVDWGQGDDQYAAGAQAQGAGFMGVGVLWDRGGNDSYRSTGFAQGAGAFGLGLLLDESGNDHASSSGRAQGFASTAGLGAYLDLGGNDERRIGVPGSTRNSISSGGGQGASWGTRPFPWTGDLSLHGGVALLYDRSGDDRNYAYSMGQASAWFMSLALHLDRAGNDQYICGRSCQGAAEHLSAALLLDGDGNDRYESSQLAQGAGDDRAVGILWDRGTGVDLYRLALQGREPAHEIGRGQGFARQPHALGVLVDGGGNDRYETTREGLGHAEPSRHPGRNPTALLIDLGGVDSYLESQQRAGTIPRDSSTWLAGEGAAGMDAFFASPGWTTTGFEPVDGFLPVSWNRSLLEPKEGTNAQESQPEVDPTAELWTRLEDRFTLLITQPEQPLEESELNEFRVLAESAPSVAVRRAAARLLITSGDVVGLRVLIASLDQASQENPGGQRGTGELGAWLSLVTGIGQDFSPAQWRSWFSAEAKTLDLTARWPAVALLEAAILSAQRGKPQEMATQCEQARNALPGDPFIHSRAAALVGRWAWVLGHPESHGHRDSDLALDLARLWVSWQPDRAAPFITLAQAWFTKGEYEMAAKALDSASILDPDNIRLLSLRRAMEE
jgi:hypothetical protein